MIETLARLETLRTQGTVKGPLELLRAWPRDDGHLVLEYVDADGHRVPGQWIRDSARRDKIARQTARQASDAASVVITREGVILQDGGADRRLPGLAGLVSGGTLIAHRPERRAVLRLDGDGDRRYAKVVRPSHIGALLDASRYLAAQPGRPFDVPDVLEADETRGVIVFSSLPGVAMFELLDDLPRLVTAATRAGEALRWLHGLDPPGVHSHDAAAEMGLLEERLQRLATYHPAVHRKLGGAPQTVLQALARGTSPRGVVHRDFYDKQIVVGDGDRIGLLDFDTLAVGESVMDVANMLVHFELRALQARSDRQAVHRGAEAFLAGYGTEYDADGRLQAWADATRLRLACLYAYRPRWAGLSERLLGRIGEGLPVASCQ